MSIKILKQGVLTTLQDAGRTGYRSMGIGMGGAMDSFAAAVSNFLVGNGDTKAIMEINFPAPEILFQQDAVISLTGADFSAKVNDVLLNAWQPFFINAGSILKFSKPPIASKAYLAVAGGWKGERWLDSFSTHLKVEAGGYKGRAFKKEDIIEFETNNFLSTQDKLFNWSISGKELEKIYQPNNSFRCIRSAEWHWLDGTSKENFEQQDFVISNQSDRMGYRLTGEKLKLLESAELISSPVDVGTIQLLPDGNAIVLMADCQTTGGYPRIASVIKADIPKFSQLVPGQKINFSLVDIGEAEDAYMAMTRLLEELKEACHLNFNKII